jgi:stage II sporulation protein D
MVKHALTAVAVISAAACSIATPPTVGPVRAGAASVSDPVRVGVGAGPAPRVVAVALEDYVFASVLSELAPAPGDAGAIRTMFEVQSIVARTYAAASRGRHAAEGFDVCSTTHCQLVELDRPRNSRWASLAREAVDATRGQLLWYAGRPAAALFHADCGGYRAAAHDVWGGPRSPYLQGGSDPLPPGHEHVAWRFDADRERLRSALNGNPRTSVGARLDTIDVYRRDASGRAALLLLNGERSPLVRGEEFRRAISRALGTRSLRSARFDVFREGDRFVFEGQGFGHGVGLCQRGALARAAAGETAAQILAFYFPGTSPPTQPSHRRPG